MQQFEGRVSGRLSMSTRAALAVSTDYFPNARVRPIGTILRLPSSCTASSV